MARDTSKTDEPADPARRRLLASAPVAGAAALAAAATGSASPSGGEPEDPRDVAYRETEHVKAYYARARG